MICKFCGNTIEDNSDFCFICGQKVAEEVTVENTEVFSQVAPTADEAAETVVASAPVQEALDPAAQAAPIYAQQAPIYAQQAPVYAQQAIVQQVAPAPAAPKKSKKDPSIATKAKKFFSALFAATFILQFISWLWYKGAVKKGYDKKAVDILNSTMVGLCVFMGIVCIVLISKFML